MNEEIEGKLGEEWEGIASVVFEFRHVFPDHADVEVPAPYFHLLERGLDALGIRLVWAWNDVHVVDQREGSMEVHEWRTPELWLGGHERFAKGERRPPSSTVRFPMYRGIRDTPEDDERRRRLLELVGDLAAKR